MRINREARVFPREALLGLRKPELVAQHVHEIGGVSAVEHAEARVQADSGGVAANQAVGDRVKRAGPGDADRGLTPAFGYGIRPPNLAHDALRAACHFERRTAREGEKENAFRPCARQHQVRHAMRQRIRLACPGARDNQ